MANFAYNDDGFKGRLNAQQQLQIRDEFRFNQWPDSSQIFSTASKIGK